METIAGKPYWRISFDADGNPTDSVADQFIAEVDPGTVTDVFVFSHGWGTSMSGADELYNDMFPRLEKAANAAGLTSAGYAGVFWPALWFPDPAPARMGLLRPDLGATNPGAVNALLSGAEIATSLSQGFTGPSDAEALNRMANLIDQGLVDAARGVSVDEAKPNILAFHEALNSLVRKPPDAPEDRGENALLSSAAPERDYARLAAVMGTVPVVAELGLGDLGNVWNGAKDALRIASYYEMKGRAGVIGATGLGPRLESLHAQAPAVRVHLIGHSFGARLVSYALSGITTADRSPVASLTIVQGAFSHWSFTPGPNMPWGDAGALTSYADRVHGPLLSTLTQFDWAVGQWYPRASFFSQTDNSLARQLSGAPSQWGGLGADGYQGVDSATDLDIQNTGTPYDFQAGHFYRVNAEAVIKDTAQSSFAGAHSDIRHDEIAGLILAAATPMVAAGLGGSNNSEPPDSERSSMSPGSPVMVASGPPASALDTQSDPNAESQKSASTTSRPRRDAVSFWLTVISTAIVTGGLAVIIVYSYGTPDVHHVRHLSVGILTALAALAAGSLLGFLFGIPRVVSSGELRHKTTNASIAKLQGPGRSNTAASPEVTAASPGSGFTPSTNLAEVSDWLTKLLLGAGLVQLTHLGRPLGKLINSVAAGLEDVQTRLSGSARVMAAVILFTYVIVGFLDGYLVTTLWYGRRLDRIATE